MKGRHRRDTVHGSLPRGIRRGDYWREINEDGQPCHSPDPENLTHEIWWVAAPNPTSQNGKGFMLGRLTQHTVRFHPEDNTISVRPGDGSSNSILISGAREGSWHGYIEHGEWRQA